MKKHKLANYTNGWIMGRFNPALFNSDLFEIAIKHYKAGDTDPAHYHAIAREFTAVVSGCIQMNDEYLCEGEIIEVDQNEIVKFQAITDATLVVVKVPSIPGDKYIVKPE
jgi:mannose-6-phosphate isomerase-like protein (cupin superfamily)